MFNNKILSIIAAAGLFITPVITMAAGNTPHRGMSMDSVQTQLGEPAEKIFPVGDPPITRWVYEGFIVYFEHNLVIHSVMKQTQPAETE